jgi:hypothetical protein
MLLRDRYLILNQQHAHRPALERRSRG